LSCDWYVFWLAMACKFFGGLTNVRRLATADGLALNRLAMARNGGGLQVYYLAK